MLRVGVDARGHRRKENDAVKLGERRINGKANAPRSHKDLWGRTACDSVLFGATHPLI
jgi:hypothetical protein